MAPLQDVDMLIIGAGISGLGMACQMRRKFPNLSFSVVEKRAQHGGTWDLFKYPGIRSDSPMQSFAYSWHPWSKLSIRASASEILWYQKGVMKKYDLDADVIAYNTAIKTLKFNTTTCLWTATTEDPDVSYTARFVYAGTGYYDQEKGYIPDFKGVDDFKGEVLQPMHWPENFSCEGKDVVIIGSGSSAVTIAPAICDVAMSVTVVQRSPGYVVNQPGRLRFNPLMQRLLSWFPPLFRLYTRCYRFVSVFMNQYEYWLATRFPNFAQKMVLQAATDEVGEDVVTQHFTPKYNVWDQRVCVASDGDLFQGIKAGKIRYVTDTIDTFTEDGLRLTRGDEYKADVIVSATGMTLEIFGKIDVFVDREPFVVNNSIMYRSIMFSGLPNLFYGLGATNQSWTVKVEFALKVIEDIMKYMDYYEYKTCVLNKTTTDIREGDVPLNSGYFTRNRDKLPKLGLDAPFHWGLYVIHDYFSYFWNPISRDPSLTFA
ncbi:hypothetical protein SARC_03521 [Sphaeroforma arctica JP610]|uniref:FAD-containing monooxygenase EthA n=1 Tax=Sphaeroforma arctica JP610 TaxID=667725 RepID=A0A0L0G5E5_9EUKA|nr:hypothetical protein SARC_03521 [Sphaeroforma arctica JP610]KNC84250.1 hypothetical protein SARC_03521 [Sphaeroforma arctica JP610]|eukprot:XP_014158152.1 hypothetical protein SARC_03521 [Sphaeroforma arctica JP610]